MQSGKERMESAVNWPVWDEKDVDSVEAVVRSGQWWAGAPGDHAGESVWKFQEEFADYHEIEHCIGVFNGTVAIEIALLALGVGLGDEVIVYAGDQPYRYIITTKRIVEPTEVSVLAQTTKPVATLISCFPYMVDTHRIVVVAELQ